MQRSAGFTLIEIIMVVVLMGILAGVLTPIIAESSKAYVATQSRSDLTARGRIALQRLAREVRSAVPNSLRVIGGSPGNTLEFVTTAFGGRVVKPGLSAITTSSCPHNHRFVPSVSRTTLCLLYPAASNPFAIDDVVVIGNSAPALLDGGGTHITATAVTGSAPLWSVSFAAHSFVSDTPSSHYLVADYAHEVGRVGTTLRWKRASGVDSGLYNGSSNVTAADALLIDGLLSASFEYDAANGEILVVTLAMEDGAEQITMVEEIDVRNSY